ncbi:MAG: DUF3108 domain-containing protein [Alphaproteobacteria bacterium]|nr:DUF3108 domain-containing protein [Alphaproteobacteria bacterium]
MRACLPLLVGGLLFPLAASAQPAPEQRAGYEIYAAGVPVAVLKTGFALGPSDYRIDLSFHTTGLVGWLYGGRQQSNVEGEWRGDRPAPRRFAGEGMWGGRARQTLIDYIAGQPLVRSLLPPNDEEREPVPAALQANSMDALSAIAMLIRRVARTNRCEGQATTFDGRRAMDLVARTVGEEVLPPSTRSVFTGRALRCDFEGRLLAGFLRDADQPELRRPRHGSAWLAQITPGVPPIPVRIEFETRWFGIATMYLTEAGSGPVRGASAR